MLEKDKQINKLSNKVDSVASQQNNKILKQQLIIGNINTQLKEKDDEIQKIKEMMEEKKSNDLWENTVLYDYDIRWLVTTGWKCVYRKSYSHKTTSGELKSLCGQNTDIFVGACRKDNPNKIILGAFGPSSVLHKFTDSTKEAFIPADVKDKNGYKVYWYHKKQ
eukprot:304150_1